MAQERVITGEAVEVELPVARLATRTLAVLIDGAAQYTAVLVLYAGLGTLLFDTDPALSAAVLIGTLVFVFLIWPVTFETVTRGRSLGKLAMGLRVVRDDGGPIRFRHALVRGLIGVSIEWPGLLFAPLSWLVGAVTMLASSKGKRIGDLAAGTMVLQERLPDRGRYVADMPPQLASWAADLDLTRVDDRLGMAIRQYLSRAHQMRPVARSVLGNRLMQEVLRVTTPPPPPGTSGWWYLRAVLAERRRREERKLAAQRALVALGAPSAFVYVPGSDQPRAAGSPGAGPAPVSVAASTGYAAPN